MQMVRIRFPDDRSRTEGFYELLKRVRVVCLPHDEFVIPKAGLSILDARSASYTVLEQNGVDCASDISATHFSAMKAFWA